MQPQLLGIVAHNSGGFGDIGKAAQVWAPMELAPLQARMTAINDWLGYEMTGHYHDIARSRLHE